MINMIQCGRDDGLALVLLLRLGEGYQRQTQQAPATSTRVRSRRDACCLHMPTATRTARTDWMRPAHNRAAGIQDDGQLGESRLGDQTLSIQSRRAVASAKPSQLPTSEVVVALHLEWLGGTDVKG